MFQNNTGKDLKKGVRNCKNSDQAVLAGLFWNIYLQTTSRKVHWFSMTENVPFIS